MGWLSALIGGAFDTSISAYTQESQKKENQKDRNFNAEQAELNRQFQSDEAALNRDFQSKEAEMAYERQREYYETYSSPQAMVQQYKEAGLNPVLAAGGVGGSTPPPSPAASGSAASGSAASSHGSSLPQIVGLAETALGIKDMLEKIKLTRAEAEKTSAEGEKIKKETSWIDTYNTTSIESMKSGIEQVRSNIKVNEQQVQESLQRVQESLKRMDKMDSEIEVNGALVDLHGSQQVLNESRSAVEKLNAKQIEQLLPYIQARQEAEIALANAKTEEAKYSAENHMYDANLKMLKSLVDAKLIDSSYYDSVIDQAHWDAKYKKREYKWKPVNDICHNISMLAIGAGSVMSGAGSMMTGMSKGVAEGVKDVATLNFF